MKGYPVNQFCLFPFHPIAITCENSKWDRQSPVIFGLVKEMDKDIPN